jgi:hypothetical protein
MDLQCITDRSRAGLLLHPLRARILENTREPASATEVGALLGVPRQKVNYHFRELSKAGFLRPAGRRRKGNMIEKRYVATARAWVLTPEVLGAIGADPGAIDDSLSAAYLLALASRIQSDLASVTRDASAEGKRVPTLSIDTDIRFESAAQRKAFTKALEEAVAGVIRRHSSPAFRKDGRPGKGRPYRLALGCYPAPRDSGKSGRKDR